MAQEIPNNNINQSSGVNQEKDISQINQENLEKEQNTQVSQPTQADAPITSTPNSSQEVQPEMAYEDSKRSAKLEDSYGSPSLFNRYAIFVHPKSDTKNGFKKFYDKEGEEKIYPNQNIETSKIIDELKKDDRKKLFFSDFAYAKYHKFIPNNRLIVLRRFPFPTFNNLSFVGDNGNKRDIKPLSQGITYFGGETGNDLSEILKIAGYKNYKELTAEMDFKKGVDKGLSDSPFASSNSTANKALKGFSAASGRGDTSGREADKVDQLLGKNWENERKGPENVIHKTNIADVGVGANLEFTIVFEYKLRSFNGINPRVALLDLLSNLMTLVHVNGEFWGGSNVVLPSHQKFPFIGNQDDFYNGNYSSYLGSVVDWFKEPFSSGGGFKNLIDGIMSGDLSSIGDFLGDMGSTVLDLSSSKSRSSVIGLKALLDSSPIGNHHIQIGNPLDPIISMGNLIVPSFDLSFNDELGFNDFPTELKLSVDLKTATPLDSTGIQGIFANGDKTNRMYMKPSDFIDVAGSVKNGKTTLTKDEIYRAEGFIF